MRKPNYKRRKQMSDEMSLQITSMADIFVILLVFLLKSYATSAVNLSPSNGTLLPEAQAGEAAVEALKLEISQNAVSVEGQPVVELKNFVFSSGDMQTNGSSKTLSAALEKERKRQLAIAKMNADVKVDAKIIVVADQKAPYLAIKTALASAALNGYTDFKLAVVKGE